MDAGDSIVYLRFPPLAGVLALESAPSAVPDLLVGRWMAELAAGTSGGGSFLIRWRAAAGPPPAAGDAVQPVEWRPEAGCGVLRNPCGRVLLSPGTEESTVELVAGALERPACLEPLVEAALGDALAAGGECFLHAAAVELRGRRLLLIGDTGSGKSTVAAAVAACGGRVISDDSLILGRADRRPLVRAARRSLWLRPGSAALLPALHARGLASQEAADGRIRIDRERSPGAFRLSTEPDCLILLERLSDGEGPVARPLAQAEALAALLRGTSALYVTDDRFADRRRRLFDIMTRFAEELPAIELRLGRSLLESTEECLAAVADSLP